MATASPHKKMMVLSLQQLEGNLLNLERDRANLITSVPFGPRTSDELPFEVLLREASQCCKEQGEILLYITRLTLTPGYYERPHRIQRLLYLLDSLMHCVDTVIDAAERIYAHRSITEWPKTQKFFVMARRMLTTGRDMMKIQHASNNWENSEGNVFRDSSFTVSVDGGIISKSEYLQKPAPYTWHSSGQNLLREVSSSKADLLGGTDFPEPYIEHSSDYFRISRAVSNNYFNVPIYQLRGRPFEHPIILAQALQDINIEIGFIFADDLNVVVWPLGKGAPTAKGSVVVHCTCTIHDRDLWSYKVLRPCVSESKETGQLNIQDIRKPSEMNTTRLPNTAGSRKQEPPSVFGASNAGKCFFDLPPELRNMIYRDCIERPCFRRDGENLGFCGEYHHDHYGEERSQNLTNLGPTALCRTSRRVRDEILPLLLASKAFAVSVPTPPLHDTCCSLVDGPVLTDHNKWLARSSNTAYLRYIRIWGASSRKSSFAVWVRLTDIGSGFTLTPDEGTHWEPEKTPGGYNLPALLRIMILDKETVGLSMADVACIADFIGEKYNSWPRY
ncbi:hypothetical protein KC343_g14821 [Hortaea werneckii]|nr:hypothetical protein KC352_g26871 [Hortaea werneckii]KAI7548443.1 hypothetical protein KC317_g14849 [Hortaea werneckii]KAI7597357.1 hypothetical protein KC346_g14716 [Hortaea werneckii]KAI7602503.1 hypothetical protein KC343_g14821 [Hortaea werneckii]KAI7639107.1 hypothetical protein KC319_g14553 [Hortaea werneckii]